MLDFIQTIALVIIALSVGGFFAVGFVVFGEIWKQFPKVLSILTDIQNTFKRVEGTVTSTSQKVESLVATGIKDLDSVVGDTAKKLSSTVDEAKETLDDVIPEVKQDVKTIVSSLGALNKVIGDLGSVLEALSKVPKL